MLSDQLGCTWQQAGVGDCRGDVTWPGKRGRGCVCCGSCARLLQALCTSRGGAGEVVCVQHHGQHAGACRQWWDLRLKPYCRAHHKKSCQTADR